MATEKSFYQLKPGDLFRFRPGINDGHYIRMEPSSEFLGGIAGYERNLFALDCETGKIHVVGPDTTVWHVERCKEQTPTFDPGDQLVEEA